MVSESTDRAADRGSDGALVRSAVRMHEDEICDGTAAKLLPSTRKAMDALIDSSLPSDEHDAQEGADWRSTSFSVLKTIRDVSVSRVCCVSWRSSARLRLWSYLPTSSQRYSRKSSGNIGSVPAEPPREVRRHPEPIRYTLLAAFWQRRQEIIDGLVDLLIQIVHRISVRAEKKVVDELLGDLQKVHGKTTLLFKMAEAALEQPEGVVREVLYPVVSEQTLSDLVKEYRAHGPTYRRHVYTILRASYSGHYRRMLPLLLMPSSSGPTRRRIAPSSTRWPSSRPTATVANSTFPWMARCPLTGSFPRIGANSCWSKTRGEIRVNRINYEISALHSLREGLRCKAIWVVGADRFRNPDEDLPADFDTQRTTYYAALQQPESAEDFIAGVRKPWRMLSLASMMGSRKIRKSPCARRAKTGSNSLRLIRSQNRPLSSG